MHVDHCWYILQAGDQAVEQTEGWGAGGGCALGCRKAQPPHATPPAGVWGGASNRPGGGGGGDDAGGCSSSVCTSATPSVSAPCSIRLRRRPACFPTRTPCQYVAPSTSSRCPHLAVAAPRVLRLHRRQLRHLPLVHLLCFLDAQACPGGRRWGVQGCWWACAKSIDPWARAGQAGGAPRGRDAICGTQANPHHLPTARRKFSISTSCSPPRPANQPAAAAPPFTHQSRGGSSPSAPLSSSLRTSRPRIRPLGRKGPARSMDRGAGGAAGGSSPRAGIDGCAATHAGADAASPARAPALRSCRRGASQQHSTSLPSICAAPSAALASSRAGAAAQHPTCCPALVHRQHRSQPCTTSIQPCTRSSTAPTLLPSSCAMPSARAVLPVPGAPLSSSARPANFFCLQGGGRAWTARRSVVRAQGRLPPGTHRIHARMRRPAATHSPGPAAGIIDSDAPPTRHRTQHPPDHVHHHARRLAGVLLPHKAGGERHRRSILAQAQPLDVGVGGDALRLGGAGHLLDPHGGGKRCAAGALLVRRSGGRQRRLAARQWMGGGGVARCETSCSTRCYSCG